MNGTLESRINAVATKIGKAMARDAYAQVVDDGKSPSWDELAWSGLDAQDGDQIPADLAPHFDDISKRAWKAYESAIESKLSG